MINLVFVLSGQLTWIPLGDGGVKDKIWLIV